MGWGNRRASWDPKKKQPNAISSKSRAVKTMRSPSPIVRSRTSNLIKNLNLTFTVVSIDRFAFHHLDLFIVPQVK